MSIFINLTKENGRIGFDGECFYMPLRSKAIPYNLQIILGIRLRHIFGIFKRILSWRQGSSNISDFPELPVIVSANMLLPLLFDTLITVLSKGIPYAHCEYIYN